MKWMARLTAFSTVLLALAGGCGSTEVETEPIELNEQDPVAAQQLQRIQQLGQQFQQTGPQEQGQ